MTNLTSIVPITIIIILLASMIFCLFNLSKKDSTKYLSKGIWTFIIVFGSLIGQIAYILLEKE